MRINAQAELQPQQTQDGSHTAFSTRYQQTYHSSFGALTESEQVFLHGSGVAQQLQKGIAVDVLEVGFGLGLNFLISADYAIAHGASLRYDAWEHDPIDALTFRALNYRSLLQQPQLVDQVATLFDQLAQNEHQVSAHFNFTTPEDSALTLIQGNAVQLADASIKENALRLYDAIYLDAFSPDTNPECWSESFLEKLYGLLKPEGRLASYCVKGSVQRALKNAGFSVAKKPGPPGKREILCATKHK